MIVGKGNCIFTNDSFTFSSFKIMRATPQEEQSTQNLEQSTQNLGLDLTKGCIMNSIESDYL